MDNLTQKKLLETFASFDVLNRNIFTQALQGIPISEIAVLYGLPAREVASRISSTGFALRKRKIRMALVAEFLGLEKFDEKFDPMRTFAQFVRVVPGAGNPVRLVLEWDPEVVTEIQYASLVAAIGDLVRAEGGEGIERVKSQGIGIGIPCNAGVPL